MRIKLHQQVAGGASGDVVDVPDDQLHAGMPYGEWLCRYGYASAAEPAKPAKAAAVVEGGGKRRASR